MSDETYKFLDCGDGRRLEELGGVVVSRPAPAAAFSPRLGQAEWSRAALRFDRDGGWRGEAPPDWRTRLGGVTLALRPAAGGQIGVFPEHAAVAERVAELAETVCAGRACRVLNLFAHTGLATLRLATRTGTEVAHVDAAPASVKAARENAALSRLGAAPVRWLVDDAMRFMERETRRGKGYQVVMADPPSFGRAGRGGREWKFDKDFPGLLDAAAGLLDAGEGVLCVTCHSAGWTAGRLLGEMRRAVPGWETAGDELFLRSAAGGNDLPAGVAGYAWKKRG